MTDVNSGLSDAEPAADLDSIINTAYETHTKDDTPAAEPAVEASPDPVVDDAGRLRGPDGKFVAKEPDPAAKAPDKGTAEVAATESATPSVEPAQVQPIEPPARWTPDEKAKFAAWPRDVQEAVVERHKAMEADYTRKTQETAELRRSAEPILNAVAPYQQYLNQLAPRIGQTPDKMIGQLLGVEYQLRTGDPHEKVTALYQIAQSYGIDLAAISRGEMPAGPDPAYLQLRQSFGTIEQRLAQVEQERESERQRQTAQEIEAFATAKDASGKPLRPHFEWARVSMGHILSSDPTLTLEQAYQKATEPLQAVIAQELQSRQQAADTQRQEAVEKAKKAAPVKTSGSSAPNGSSKATDLDSILSAQLDRHYS